MDIYINTHRIRLSSTLQFFDKNKATIIFLHDSLGCIELWRDLPERIRSTTSCNVLAYDRQGYGQSDHFTISSRNNDYLKTEAKVLHHIITHLQLENVILFGHSDGGTIALLAAALYPNQIKGIITEGAHIFVEEQTIHGIQKAVTAYTTTNLKEKLYKYHGKKTDNVFRMWHEIWLSKEFRTWNIEEYLSKITCSALIIQGENDEYGTIAQVDRIVSSISGSTTALLIPNIGHTPHKENPEIVIQKSSEFIQNITILNS